MNKTPTKIIMAMKGHCYAGRKLLAFQDKEG